MLNAPSTGLAPTTASGSMALLQLMAQDRSLLSKLEKNPRAVLEAQGVFLGDQEIPQSVSLPSAEEIQEVFQAFNEAGKDFHGFFGGGGD